MNRDQYIQMRRTGQYDLGWFYQYYLENKSKDKGTPPFEVFHQAFNMYFQMNGGVIIENMDRKMEVSKIEDSNGNLLYIN
jgi:hypothetical protein